MTYAKSPLNYTGGKYKLLPQILPLFKQTDVFHDIFCGGANVAVNVQAQEIYAHDINGDIIALYQYWQKTPIADIITTLEAIIRHYKLSETNVNGYDYYHCNSSDGLSGYNKPFYTAMRTDYNQKKYHHFPKEMMFYALVVFGFNNQIRKNGKNEFNMPCGKRDFNLSIRKNLTDFVGTVAHKNIHFTEDSFEKNVFDMTKSHLVYADPPYLISTATYNESDGWNLLKEQALLDYLLDLHKKGIYFALSNVIEHKGQQNTILIQWINDHRFTQHTLNFHYKNSSYHGKNHDITTEVLVTNY